MPETAMNTEKEIERLREVVVVRTSQLENEAEPPGTDECRFDAPVRRGAVKLLRTAVSDEKQKGTAA
jgi:hypothetical protein